MNSIHSFKSAIDKEEPLTAGQAAQGRKFELSRSSKIFTAKEANLFEEHYKIELLN